jgi:hypothetical protein
LLHLGTVRILEARFHPHSKKSDLALPVARLACDGPRVTIQPLPISRRQLRPFDPDGLIAKLNFLVQTAIPRPYEGLTTLRSDYWSFVDVAASG